MGFHMKQPVGLIICVLLLSACASNIPLEIREDISESKASISAVRSDINRYVGSKVRWGGSIASVQNKKNETWIELVGRPLGSYGEPQNRDESQGRFIVRINEFLDPAIYKEGRRMTVYGVVEGKVEGFIDEHPYTYPLVTAGTHYLWDEYASRRYYYPDYYYPYSYYPFSYHFGYYHWPYRRFGYGLQYHYW